ncbi:MAG: hypothetical protein GTO51_10760 [Candidatus Latescibacteria bacterium]|nr:hypothetical protein [Candidatus Latescibacterota bacterium]NIM66446.1 hypothetical protein [Candidatus Latescibacterota bacterium]NIO02926.1 hypothetical protein [Candidatus Latescibacterota bacterium]NIO30061.1 hypothetical protein [Candidatus Latescibacterota bacterium]NIO57676.1 hypothetical protein [Candidatus Latescibacterota bacterium]
MAGCVSFEHGGNPNKTLEMDPKIASILEKIGRERSKGNHSKALKRLSEAIEKFPGEIQLYKDGIELGLEAGEQLRSIQFLKKSMLKFAGEREMLWEFALTQVKKYSEPILGKYLLDQSIKKRDLIAGLRVVQYLDERAARDLLSRTQMKKQTLSSAARGGQALSGELLINELSEALLNLRTGRVSEAIECFVLHLDRKPEECRDFEPFFQELEKSYPQKGTVRYALGSCLLLSNQIEKGVKKIAQAVKLNASLADKSAEILETIKSQNDSPPESLEIALLETYLMQGDAKKVSAHAQSILDKRPHSAQLILDSINSSLGKDPENLELQKFYLDLALSSGQNQRILGHLKNMCENPSTRRDILEWLDVQLKDGALSVEIQLFFGKEVLEDGRVDWAIDIFRETASSYPNDAPSIAHILEKYLKVDPKIGELYRELDAESASAQNSDGFDVQQFEKSEFSFSSFDQGVESPEQKPMPASPSFTLREISFDAPEEASPEPEKTSIKTPEHEPLFEQTRYSPPEEEPSERSRAPGADSIRDQATEPIDAFQEDRAEGLQVDDQECTPMDPPDSSTGKPQIEDQADTKTEPTEELDPKSDQVIILSYSADDEAKDAAEPTTGETSESALEARPSTPEEPADKIPERPEARTSQSSEAARTMPKTSSQKDLAREKTAEVPAEAAPSHDSEILDRTATFDSTYKLFLEGSLDNTTILDLAETAIDLGRFKEAKALLTMSPKTREEAAKRILRLADYYSYLDKPLPALVALKSIDLTILPYKEKREFLTKIASCYRELKMYDAAHSVCLQLMNEYPSCPDIEKLARRNYQDYLNECCEGAPVLEKVSLLNR